MEKETKVEQTLILVRCKIDLHTLHNYGYGVWAKEMDYYENRTKDNLNNRGFTDDFEFALPHAEGFVGRLAYIGGAELPDLKYFKVEPPEPYHQFNNRYPKADRFNVSLKERYPAPFVQEMYDQGKYYPRNAFVEFRVNEDELVEISRDEAKTRLVNGNRIVITNKHEREYYPNDKGILNIFWLIPGVRIEKQWFVCGHNLDY